MVHEEIEVKILRVDTEERKIGLSRKRDEWAEEDEEEAETAALSAGPAVELKGGVGSQSGPLFQPASAEAEKAPSEDTDNAGDVAVEETVAEEASEAETPDENPA